MDNTITKNASVLTIFKLEAIDCIEDANTVPAVETMLIGFFDSIDSCNKVEEDYRKLPGFSLKSCKFVKTPYSFSPFAEFDVDHVFYVQWCKTCELTGEEESFEIGLFLSQKEAEAAIMRWLAENKLGPPQGTDKDNLDIYIAEYRINQRHWQDGFIRYTWFPEE